MMQRVLITMGLLACVAATQAREPTPFIPSASDFGSTGLLQMPTARMAEEGSLRVTMSRTEPYSRYSIVMQPFAGLEASMRYAAIGNEEYGVTRDQSYKDKSIDVKFRLLEESRYLPELALGMRDLAGTGVFSSEYLVASKRFGQFDFSLGLGWGQLGHRNSIGTPFGERGSTEVDFSNISYFKGPVALFGGVEYKSATLPLRLKLEYDSNDYQHEFRDQNQLEVDSPWNVGMHYQIAKNIDIMFGYERGNTWMIGLSLHENIKQRTPLPKADIIAPAVVNYSPEFAPSKVSWPEVASQLAELKIPVDRIEVGSKEVTVFVENQVFADPGEMVGLVSRVLANTVPADILWFNIVTVDQGMALNETSIRRDHFVAAVHNRLAPEVLESSTEQLPPYAKHDRMVYQGKSAKLDYNFTASLPVNIGGPDAFLLYQLRGHLDIRAKLSRKVALSARLSAGLYDNYDIFNYDGPAGTGVYLPRVRTLIKDYVKGSKAWVDHLQLSYASRMGNNWFGMAYAGLLESMYGGVGVEFLYRPHRSHWAVGVDMNYVKQRDFDRRFRFRDYSAVTGHATMYYYWEKKQVLIKASVGQYLAEDIGVTLDLSKQFKNGMKVGVFASKTNVSSKEFGEGSFDKGIYLNIPFDFASFKHNKEDLSLTWQPLIRDGGAKLVRQNTLYEMTSPVSLESFGQNPGSLIGPVSLP